MNIKRFDKLNESEKIEISPTQFAQINSDNVEPIVEKYQDIIENDLNQFKFDCGKIMAKINVDINTRFGLRYHAENTTSLEDFIESVEKFIMNNLTENDINNLTREYRKYFPEN